MSGGDWAGAIGAGGVFVLMIVIVWQVAATWRARMMASREDQYRQMALKYQQLLEDNIELHRRSVEQMTYTRESLESVEKQIRALD